MHPGLEYEIDFGARVFRTPIVKFHICLCRQLLINVLFGKCTLEFPEYTRSLKNDFWGKTRHCLFSWRVLYTFQHHKTTINHTFMHHG